MLKKKKEGTCFKEVWRREEGASCQKWICPAVGGINGRGAVGISPRSPNLDTNDNLFRDLDLEKAEKEKGQAMERKRDQIVPETPVKTFSECRSNLFRGRNGEPKTPYSVRPSKKVIPKGGRALIGKDQRADCERSSLKKGEVPAILKAKFDREETRTLGEKNRANDPRHQQVRLRAKEIPRLGRQEIKRTIAGREIGRRESMTVLRPVRRNGCSKRAGKRHGSLEESPKCPEWGAKGHTPLWVEERDVVPAGGKEHRREVPPKGDILKGNLFCDKKTSTN